MEKMINSLALDDLEGAAYDLAEVVGIEAFRELVRVYGGGQLYIPLEREVCRPQRDIAIRRAYNGRNVRQLARRYELTDRTVQRIVECVHTIPGQLRFDDESDAKN
jgi:Mor family transcriptional regulator